MSHTRAGASHIQLDDLLERAAAAVDFVEHQGQRVFDRRQARRRAAVAGRIGLALFFERVRGVIGRDDLNAAVQQRLPQPAVVVGRFQRRVHLHERAQAGVVVDVEEQVMRADFGRDQAAMIGEQIGFVAGRNVQHVKAVLVPEGQVDRPPRGDDRRGVVANAAVIGDVGRAGKPGGIGPDGRFVFAVGTDRQRRLGKDRFQRRLVIDEQIARAGADEDLDPRRARRAASAPPGCAASRRCRSRS